MKLRIFVVDDETCIVETLSYFLNKLGHEVIPASSATFCHALEKPCDCQHRSDHCGDILLIDQNMPGLSGLDFIVQQSENGRRIAPLMTIMSANLGDEQVRQASELGCDLLPKPLTYAKLTSWLTEVQERIPSQRQLPPREELNCSIATCTML